jgi:phosphonate metabolism-associated iron-containing alcohol dehydrogenase
VWRYANPVDVTFGAGCLAHLPERLAGRRYALVTYDDERFGCLADRLEALCGPALSRLTDIQPNPDIAALARADTRFASARGAEVIVALGGGSVIDAAKVLAAARGDFTRVRRHLLEGGEALEPLPLIAIPTTAGTGSEVTCWATVWDRQAEKKYSLTHARLYPEHALVDPALTLGAPREVTLAAGLDALSHALESLWNVNANPVSTTLGLRAARRVLEVLPKLVGALDDAALREAMAEASLFAGLAFSNTKTALAHSISYPITLRTGTAHGIACAFSLPRVMRWARGGDPECDRALAAIFDCDLEAAAERLERFLEDLGVSTAPAAYGLDEAGFQALVIEALSGDRGRNFRGRVPDFAREEQHAMRMS